ncbi:hypothetical protein BU14_0342s0007 [Porphyra umbilicalis]|uniref:Uncharacterized protein n=1 Tax=Porphyra umbilicalis TaxID=2786 RepID=A0A1X6NYA8_PORUM|nr:hypothetical protein BU14_0342s0007 [Porphyra umbilicalis]|eukprot:OSX73486.1 hypothetical protein BU14_0342s0007 [Porphyra umbilicalis]
MGCGSSKPRTVSPPSSPAPRVAASPAAVRPAVTVSERDQAMLKLKVQRDKLTRFRQRMDAEDAKLTEVAKSLLASGARPRAALVLRHRTLVRQRLASTEAALANVEALTGSLETAELNASVIDALSAGNAELAALNALMPASAIAEILEEGSAQREATEAIAAELARGGDAADEEGVAEELAALEAAVAAAAETPAPEGVGGGGLPLRPRSARRQRPPPRCLSRWGGTRRTPRAPPTTRRRRRGNGRQIRWRLERHTGSCLEEVSSMAPFDALFCCLGHALFVCSLPLSALHPHSIPCLFACISHTCSSLFCLLSVGQDVYGVLFSLVGRLREHGVLTRRRCAGGRGSPLDATHEVRSVVQNRGPMSGGYRCGSARRERCGMMQNEMGSLL